MKLWILRPIESLPTNESPWEPWNNKAFGYVVRAETEKEARQLAQADAGDENDYSPWLDAKHSSCEELTAEGDAGVVMFDFASA